MLAFHLVVVVATIIVAVVVVNEQAARETEALEGAIDEQRQTLRSLSEITHRNGADGVAAAVIADCPRRDQFEDMLVNLSTLNDQELLTAQQLFESCGDFFAQRKALMVFHIEQELQAMTQFANVLNVVTESEELQDEVRLWEELVELERKRRDLLHEQVTIQESIISSLIRGAQPSSDEIGSDITRAHEVAELLSVHSEQARTLHEQLGV